jgi:all-trans-nonaprenyl-diphosphate synthase
MEQQPLLAVLIEREFSELEDLPQALALVRQSNGIQRSRQLAEGFARQAGECLAFLPLSESRKALLALPDFVLSRLY